MSKRVDHPPRVREAIDELMCKKDAWGERMSELKPCPFCGGEAELTGFDAPEFWVWCPNCKASTDAHTCKGGAIDAWNTRAERTCKREKHGTKMDGSPKLRCSLCGYGIGDKRWNYCPNCGARVTPKNSETTPKVVSE